jgi:hypothetical protein
MARSTFSFSAVTDSALAGDATVAAAPAYGEAALEGAGALVALARAVLALGTVLGAEGALVADATVQQAPGTAYDITATLAAEGGLGALPLPIGELAEDFFDRVDDASIGSAWANDLAYFGAPGFGINGNAAQNLGDMAAEHVASGAWPNDQWSAITLGSAVATVSGKGAGPVVRHTLNAGTPNFYFAQANAVETRLYRCDGAARVQLGGDGPGVVAGDVIRLEVRGAALAVKKNGTPIISANDATYASGRPGIWAAAGGVAKP